MAKTGNVPPRQEAPTYKRQSSIQPVADTAHLRYVAARQGNTAVTDMIGSLGQQISQNLSNEYAREKGIEAAKTPGRFLFPAINETTKTFNDAYRREETQILQFEAEKFLNNVYQQSNQDPNPSSKTLFAFEENAKKGIDDVLSKSRNVTPELKRHLEKSYESKYLHLSERVFDSNRRYLKEQNAAQLELNSTEMMNTIRDGNPEMSQSYHNQALQNIYTAAEQNNTPPEVVAQQEKALKNQFITGKLQKEYIDTPNKDKPKFIADLQRNTPEGIDPSDKDALVAGMMQFANKYDAAFKGEQYLAYNEASAKIKAGQLSSQDLAKLESENALDAYQLADLKNQSIYKTTKETKKAEVANSVISNSNNAIFLSNKSDKQINETVDEYILPQAAEQKGAPLSLSEQAVALSNFKSTVPVFKDRLSSAIKDGSPEDALDAAVAVKFAQANNPALIRGLDKDDLAVANLYATISKNPVYQGQEGIKKARDDVYSVDENTRIERQKRLDTYFSNQKLNDANVVKSKANQAISGGLFSTKRKLPVGASTVYLDLLRNEMMRSGDSGIAKAAAQEQFKEIYQETSINGIKGEVMELAPEYTYPGLGFVLDNDKVRALKDVVNANKSLRNEGEFTLNEFEWENEPNTSDLISKPIHEGDLTIKIDGKPRKVVVSSDIATQFSPIPQATYAFEYIDDNGMRQPLINPNAHGTSYRWIPDTKLFQSISEKYPELQLKIAEDARKKFLEERSKQHPDSIYTGDYNE